MTFPGGAAPALAGLIALAAGGAMARDQIQIAGSSTVLPYAMIAAEAFGENFDFPTPVVEGGGSGTGRARLCAGLGETTIDIADSSSRIRQSDLDTCARNGVGGVIEVVIGHDGIVLASAADGPAFALTPADLFGALAAEVIEDGALVPNRRRLWSEVNPSLPAQRILAFIPGTRHGSRETFDHRLILEGCAATGARDALAARGLDARGADAACLTLRKDGSAVDIDGDYTEALARLQADHDAIGAFGLSFYLNNTGRLRLASVDGVMPSVATIASGEYPVARPLYMYVKIAHLDVIPGLRAFLDFLLSDEVAGPGGLLSEYGLVPDPALAATRDAVARRVAVELRE